MAVVDVVLFVVVVVIVVAAIVVVAAAAVAVVVEDVPFASATIFAEPDELRVTVGSCELDDSESELDELLSEPLELPLDDEESDEEPELDSVLVD